MYDAKLRDLYVKSDLPLNLQRFFKNLKLASSLSLGKIFACRDSNTLYSDFL